MVGVPRVSCWAVQRRLGIADNAELRRGRAPEQYDASVAVAPRQPGIGCVDNILAETAATGARPARDADPEVLDEERYAGKRRVSERRGRGAAGRVESTVDDSVERGVERFDALNRGIDDLER